MYDKWVEDVEEGKLVGVMMIDLSAAFDMVDHTLLLEKLHLFGLELLTGWKLTCQEDSKVCLLMAVCLLQSTLSLVCHRGLY